MVSCDKMLLVKNSLLLNVKKHEKFQIWVMDLVVIEESLSCYLAGL